MEHVKQPFPDSASISWFGDSLVDWVTGGRRIEMNGVITPPTVQYSYKFDAALQSDCGRYAVIYETLGTKGLVLAEGEVVREINRSYYHADMYEYPIALYIDKKHGPLLAHCPEEYNQLKIEQLLSGENIYPNSIGSAPDIFHSRLRISPGGKYVLSAGWLWHPFDHLSVHNLSKNSLNTPLELPEIDAEVSGADFITDDLVLICTSSETLNDETASDKLIGGNSIAVVDLSSTKIKSQVKTNAQLGNCWALDETQLLSFHGHPKLVSIQTGEILAQWHDIHCGNGQSSIKANELNIGTSVAVDIQNRRFAVCSGQDVNIVTSI